MGYRFTDLTTACQDDWRAYIEHDFVHQLGNATLPEASFRHYLKQDYLFLIHFARAYALADALDWPEGFCRRDIGWRAL